ncbi:hypothetical protein HUU42_02835 [bacterium]|nr:hypothetical protein [bacterium]
MPNRFQDDNDWQEKEGDEEEWKKAHDEWMAQADRENAVTRSPKKNHEPLPWDETAWEVFLQNQDKDGQRVVAYYEKYWSHSDRDRMVEEALALYHVREALRQIHPPARNDSVFQKYLHHEFQRMGVDDPESVSFFDAKENSLYQITAYRLTRDCYFQLKAWTANLREPVRQNKLIENLQHHACAAYTKIAGGHIMGYHLYTIGGNIALCKRGIRHSNRVLDYVMRVKDHGWIDDEKYLYLDEIALEARNALGLHIVDLREQFIAEV